MLIKNLKIMILIMIILIPTLLLLKMTYVTSCGVQLYSNLISHNSQMTQQLQQNNKASFIPQCPKQVTHKTRKRPGLAIMTGMVMMITMVKLIMKMVINLKRMRRLPPAVESREGLVSVRTPPNEPTRETHQTPALETEIQVRNQN